MGTLLEELGLGLLIGPNLPEGTRLIVQLRILFDRCAHGQADINKQELIEAITASTDLSPGKQKITPPDDTTEGWRWLVTDALNTLSAPAGFNQALLLGFVEYADRWLQGQKMNV